MEYSVGSTIEDGERIAFPASQTLILFIDEKLREDMRRTANLLGQKVASIKLGLEQNSLEGLLSEVPESVVREGLKEVYENIEKVDKHLKADAFLIFNDTRHAVINIEKRSFDGIMDEISTYRKASEVWNETHSNL